MKLIIGLGNPGKQYRETRHNAGFQALDFLAVHFGFENFHLESRFQAKLSIGTREGEKYLLVKPATFMNQSGTSVRLLLEYYKLTPHDLVVIHDDLDVALGTLKTTHSSRAAGHNGVQHIIEQIATQDFFRIRLGIGRPSPVTEPQRDAPRSCQSIHDYVLRPFLASEEEKLLSLFPSLPALILEAFVSPKNPSNPQLPRP